MKTIILLSYNNYYNRIVKRPLQSAEEYFTDGATVILQTSNVNFYENDGVSTQLVVDYEVVDGAHPDYLLVADDDGNVIQRWYVIDSTHQSGNQRRLSLLRDVIADHYFEISTSPMFVEKAMLSVSDPAIFNDEGISVNQILTSKELLADETGCPWIVGYIPKNYPKTDIGQTGNINFNYFPTADIEVSGIENWTYYNHLGTYLQREQGYILRSTYAVDGKSYVLGLAVEIGSDYKKAVPYNTGNYEITTRFESPITYIDNLGFHTDGICLISSSLVNKIRDEVAFINPNKVYPIIKNYISYVLSNSGIESDLGKIIKDTTSGIYYKLSARFAQTKVKIPITSLDGGQLWNELNNIFNVRLSDQSYTTTGTFYINSPVYTVTYYLENIGARGICSITQNRLHLVDQPYDMFCIPYSDDIYFRTKLNDTEDIDLPFSKTMAMALAQDVATDLGTNAVYDIQILPYCPVQHLMIIEGNKKILTDQELSTTHIVDEGGNTIGAIFWCFNSQFSFEIPYKITVPEDPSLFKEDTVCDKYRLCSPNMSAFFDFSPTMNYGLDFIEVDCYYKPFNPYIHLNPRFKGLYAGEYQDFEVRGLDLGGNFSITQVSDAWANYQLQNKNFENIFNRKMDSLKMQHGVQERFDILNAFTGTVSGAASGGMTGAAAGPWGAVAGAVVGGVASGIGGAMDVNINRMLRQEQVSLQEDIFAYQKGNIQALPNSLTKVDTLSQNNPLIPYIEFYTCTQIEREAVRNILKYSGMTVGRVGTISDFISNKPQYIRGRLIRIDGIKEDFHIVQQISQELQKGVYI